MNMIINKNDDLKLKIENTDLNGNGIAKYNGIAVFVPFTAEGDEVDTHIIKVKKSYAVGKINSIITPSADRKDSECPVYLKCGGCAFDHLNYEKELEIKENHVKECFRRIAGIEPEFEKIHGSPEIYRYRNKAQYPVRNENGIIKTGFFARHSHRVIDCENCRLQPVEFSLIVNEVKKYIKDYNLTCYDETANTGLLRHIYLRKGIFSGEIMICLVINGDNIPFENELIKRLLKLDLSIKSVLLNVNKEKTNVISGKEFKTLYGKDYITDSLCGLDFRISPLSFYQVNPLQAEKLYKKAAEYANLSGTETVIDLYCGTGTIGLTMAAKAKEIIGIEIVPQAVEDAKINAEINSITNARFICSDASRGALKLKEENIRSDVVILDPPRKGCESSLIETVNQMSPEKIVYISCDPATLARDCKLFSDYGYKVLKAAPFDMFARAGHVETVVLMSRVEK